MILAPQVHIPCYFWTSGWSKYLYFNVNQDLLQQDLSESHYELFTWESILNINSIALVVRAHILDFVKSVQSSILH